MELERPSPRDEPSARLSAPPRRALFSCRGLRPARAWRVWALCALSSAAAARPAELVLGEVTGAPGGTVVVPLFLSSPDPVAAYQVDLLFDAMVLTPQAPVGGPQLGGAQVDSSQVTGGQLRLLVHSSTNAPLAGGILVEVPFVVAAAAPNGTVPLPLQAAVLAAPTSALVPSNLFAGSVEVGPGGRVSDLEVEKSVEEPYAVPGMAVTFHVVVRNLGPDSVSGAQVQDSFPGSLDQVAWICTGTLGVSCPSSGLGSIQAPLHLPANGTAAFTATAVVSTEATFPIVNTASASVPVSVDDPNSSNDTDSAQIELDVAPPKVEWLGTVGRSDDGVLSPGDEVIAAVTQVLFVFDEPLFDPEGDTDTEDVSNPANFRVVLGGPDGTIQTSGCGGVAGDDELVPVVEIRYSKAARTAAAVVDRPAGLGPGAVALLACSGGALRDLAGFPLDGDGDGTGGDTFAGALTIVPDNVAVNPNFDWDTGNWSLSGDAGGSFAWIEEDGSAAFSSGSAQLSVEAPAGTLAVLEQCIEGVGPGPYDVGGLVRIQSGVPGEPIVELEVESSSTPLCSSPVATAATPGAIVGSTSGSWLSDLSGTVALPAGALSSRVRLVASFATAATATIGIDEVHFWPSLGIFDDGFETGDFSRWSGSVGVP